jgi:ABC-type lipoprotein release transport system permease subunit
MASSATTASGIMIFGIDPNGEKEISSVAASVVEGTYFGKPNSILVGKKLADKLKLKLRSRIVLSFAGADGNIVYGAFRITGIFRTESTQFDVMNVFVHRDELSELIGAVAPIHQIVIRTNSSSLVDSVQAALRTTVDSSVIVETWKEIAPELKLTADSSDIVNAVFLGIILFALLFGLTNTLLMSVLDRTRDFGVLLAIGMYRRRLFSMIVLESLLLSFSGGIVGVLFGWIVTGYFNVQGIDLSAVSTGLSAYGIPTMLYPIVKPSTYVILAVMMTATSIVAALYPAIKAVRLKPVQAIRSIT